MSHSAALANRSSLHRSTSYWHLTRPASCPVLGCLSPAAGRCS